MRACHDILREMREKLGNCDMMVDAVGVLFYWLLVFVELDVIDSF